MNADLPKPDYAFNMRIIGHCDQGGRPGEFVCVRERDVPLVEDGAETALRAGDCGHFARGAGNRRLPSCMPSYGE